MGSWLLVPAGLLAAQPGPAVVTAETVERYHATVEPLLTKYCYDCHGDGMNKGKVAFDGFASDAELIQQQKLWATALKNVRAGLMPPDEGPRPDEAEIKQLETWIKYDALAINPANPDPGHVPVRRLNRAEYGSTIRDLMGIDFNSGAEFPPDDSGDGFDNNAEVLSISPLLLEKYLQAAELIVEQAVPRISRVMKPRVANGKDFRSANDAGTGERILANVPSTVSHTFKVERDEVYRLGAELEIRASLEFDTGHSTFICRVDGVEQFQQDILWADAKVLRHQHDVTLTAGEHVVSFEMVPLAPVPLPPAPVISPVAPPDPNLKIKAAPRSRITIRINRVNIDGPVGPGYWVPPANYALFFPRDTVPTDPTERDQYAREVLRRFATRAFRRPVDEPKVDQLAKVAREIYQQPGQSFENGIARALMAVLASPRFLFRIEPAPLVAASSPTHPLVDEYALASRLSYFLWSSTPDDELLALAGRGELRQQFRAQVKRLLADPRSQALVGNFTGQWLQARDVETVPINPRVVLGSREAALAVLGDRGEFDSPLRQAMRKETEMSFSYLLQEDRSVLELINADYAFLNERLAKHYGLPPVEGPELRRVELPADSPRGGILTQGTVLSITSNPTRTSPVKRGLFVLDNILGVPPPPPPPNIPALEDAKKAINGHEPTLREMLAAHRANPVCSSCHERMDPLGLSLENFTALGTWRDTEADQPISPAGHLATGESFQTIRELKHVLTTDRRLDYYRCLTEKLFTYALGRGMLPGDLQTIDEIVSRLDVERGRFSVLLDGILDSPAFQRQRSASAPWTVALSTPPAPVP